MLVLFAIAAIGCGDETGDKTNGAGVAGTFGGVGGTAGTAPSGGAGGTAGTGTPAGAGGTAGTGTPAGAGGTAGTGTPAGAGGTGGTAGTASGGAGGTAGMGGMSGGAGGAGGSGGMTASGGTGGAAGGGDSCVQRTLDGAPEGSTTPECAACLCEKCTTELDNCYPADDATWTGQCRALVQCGKTSPCCGKGCYGNYDFVTMTGDGPCVQEVYDAGGGKAAVEAPIGSCSMFGPPPANACAASNRFGLCTATNCKAECGSPCNPADFNQ